MNQQESWQFEEIESPLLLKDRSAAFKKQLGICQSQAIRII